MEDVNYTMAMLWYAVWPVVIFVSYKFVRMNIQHLEENLENHTKDEK